jgi:hypothetical protein
VRLELCDSCMRHAPWTPCTRMEPAHPPECVKNGPDHNTGYFNRTGPVPELTGAWREAGVWSSSTAFLRAATAAQERSGEGHGIPHSAGFQASRSGSTCRSRCQVAIKPTRTTTPMPIALHEGIRALPSSFCESLHLPCSFPLFAALSLRSDAQSDCVGTLRNSRVISANTAGIPPLHHPGLCCPRVELLRKSSFGSSSVAVVPRCHRCAGHSSAQLHFMHGHLQWASDSTRHSATGRIKHLLQCCTICSTPSCSAYTTSPLHITVSHACLIEYTHCCTACIHR